MTETATKADIREAMSAFEEFKSTVDRKLEEIKKTGAVDPVTEEKVGKLNAALDRAEDMNQKLTQTQLLAKKADEDNAEIKSRLDELEVRSGRPGQHGGRSGDEPAERKKRFNAWARAVDAAIKRGEVNLNEAQRKTLDDAAAQYKALNISDDTGGGYLAPIDYVTDEILKTIILISPVRALARIRQTAASTIKLPKRTGVLSATWAAEEDQRNPQTGLKYGALEIPTHELYAIVDISNQMFEDAAFDMGAEITAETTEQFAVAEGAAFVSGSGVGRPEGFLVNKTVIGQATNTGDANNLTGDSFIKVFHNLKSGYGRNAVWTMNRQTVGQARQLKDGVGQYIFMMGLPNGAPNTFLGAPYVETPDMPNVAAGAYPVAVGDFSKGYTLVDRIELVMLRDPFTQASSGNVRYWFRKRLGGQVTMPEAIQPLYVSV